MRHRKSGRKLGRTASHRKATMNALMTALFRHKKIHTTVARAKETRMFAEKLITRAKNAVAGETPEKKDIHARRMVARAIKDRDVLKELFSDIALKVAKRPGGYTRVVKLGQRFGDGAHVAIIELVDYNTGQDTSKTPLKPAKGKKVRGKQLGTRAATKAGA